MDPDTEEGGDKRRNEVEFIKDKKLRVNDMVDRQIVRRAITLGRAIKKRSKEMIYLGMERLSALEKEL